MMRWPRRRWGATEVITFPDGHTTRFTPPPRFWTRGGAQYWADEWRANVDTDLGAIMRIEVSEMPPPVDVYADRYWRGDTYIGPEV